MQVLTFFIDEDGFQTEPPLDDNYELHDQTLEAQISACKKAGMPRSIIEPALIKADREKAAQVAYR